MLPWVVFMIHVFDEIKEIIFHEIKIFRELYDFYKNNESIKATLIRYQNFLDIFNSNEKDLDLPGSESEWLFNPLLKTNLGKLIKMQKCNNFNCCREQKTKVALIKCYIPFLQSSMYLYFVWTNTDGICWKSTALLKIVPGEVVDDRVNIPDCVEISKQEGIVFYSLVLAVALQEKTSIFAVIFDWMIVSGIFTMVLKRQLFQQLKTLLY